jgi:Spy/CpxP family protein refolding chaperone
MLTKLKIALALCGSLAGIGGAAADGFHGGGRAEILQKYDVNKDGKLDDSEKAQMKADFQAKRAARIAKFDLDKNGKLDDTERAAMRDARATEVFKKLDTNGDGVVSLDEFKAGRGKMEHHARGRFHHGMRKGISKP